MNRGMSNLFLDVNEETLSFDNIHFINIISVMPILQILKLICNVVFTVHKCVCIYEDLQPTSLFVSKIRLNADNIEPYLLIHKFNKNIGFAYIAFTSENQLESGLKFNQS